MRYMDWAVPTGQIMLKRADGVADFEKYLSQPDFAESDLVLPNDLAEGGALGTSVALAQLLLTWVRAGRGKSIRTFLKVGDTAGHTTFVARLHGLAAAYYAPRVLDETASVDLKRTLLLAAAPRVRAMHAADLEHTSRGTEVEMVFVGNARMEFHGALYQRVPDPATLIDRVAHGRLIRSPRELNRFLKECAITMNFDEIIASLLDHKDVPLGSLLSEAFRNTAEHAYLAANGTYLHHNLRCVRFGRTLSSRERVASLSVSSTGATEVADRYYRNVAGKMSEAGLKKIQFLELSVFDSGPGFAATINQQPASLGLGDAQAVAKCFGKHQTSKGTKAGGLGLGRIMGVVHACDGFLRVRTGSVEAFFAPDGLLAPETDPVEFVHAGLAAVQGTALTIGIPIRY